MKVASTEEMRRIDQLAQEEYRISGEILMERAALAVLDEVSSLLGDLAGKRIFIFCGKGNNGGDGIALARLLLEKHAAVTTVLMYEKEQYRGLALDNIERLQKFGTHFKVWDDFEPLELEKADLIVDALLGTGSRGAPSGVIAAAIELINESGKKIIAVDIPSGINVDTGQVDGLAVKASRTVTFGLPKPGLLIYPGAGYTGELIIRNIGFPEELLQNPSLEMNFLTPAEAGALLPRREQTAHKGSTGHVLVIGGSPGLTGALALSCLGALRAGCGLVTAGLRPELFFPEKPLEVMTSFWPDLKNKLSGYSSIVFGPGLTTAGDGLDFFNELQKQNGIPLVIDADGLNLIAAHKSLLQTFSGPVILTPHPGEMSRLTGIPTAEIQKDRLGVARRFARDWGVTLVLKGARTIIAGPDGQVYINLTGNPGMATAGMGDVLAGIIGGLISQGISVTAAGVIGTFLHGMAGDFAAQNTGTPGIIAGDLLKEIPAASRILLQKLKSKESFG